MNRFRCFYSKYNLYIQHNFDSLFYLKKIKQLFANSLDPNQSVHLGGRSRSTQDPHRIELKYEDADRTALMRRLIRFSACRIRDSYHSAYLSSFHTLSEIAKDIILIKNSKTLLNQTSMAHLHWADPSHHENMPI